MKDTSGIQTFAYGNTGAAGWFCLQIAKPSIEVF